MNADTVMMVVRMVFFIVVWIGLIRLQNQKTRVAPNDRAKYKAECWHRRLAPRPPRLGCVVILAIHAFSGVLRITTDLETLQDSLQISCSPGNFGACGSWNAYR